MKIIIPGIIFLLTLNSLSLALANTNSFEIRVSYGVDYDPPSIPIGLVASAIASTQIDVNWQASTDDTGVVGYQIFRDAIQIATTSLTNWSDIGLLASTTYSYQVIAFDGWGRFSSSSAIVSATTLNENISNTASYLKLQLRLFKLIPGTNSVKISFQTNFPSRYRIRYGTTNDYNNGTVKEAFYKIDHTTVIFPLEPATKYFYEIYSYDNLGREVLLKKDNFFTLALPDVTAPANVADFTAVPLNDGAFLRWNNPPETDFVYVRILRNQLFYPQNPSDGFLVYEGSANSFFDNGAMADFDKQYYTIFTYDASLNNSSGAVVSLTTASAPAKIPVINLEPNITSGPLIDSTVLYALSVQILQNGQRQSMSDAHITLNKDLPFKIFIPVTAVPKNLKTIVATIINPTNQRNSSAYLLKINSTKSGYETLVPATYTVGESQLLLEMYDYQLLTVRRLQQQILFVDTALPEFKTVNYLSYFKIMLLGGGLISVLLIFLWRRLFF